MALTGGKEYAGRVSECRAYLRSRRIGPQLLGAAWDKLAVLFVGSELPAPLPEHFLYRDPGAEGGKWIPIPDSRFSGRV